MTDNREPEFHVITARERRDEYRDAIAHLRSALEALNDGDETEEWEECFMAHDLLSEVMGR